MLEEKHFWEIHALVCISTSSLRWFVSKNPETRAAHVGEGRTQTRGVTGGLMLCVKFVSQSPDTNNPSTGGVARGAAVAQEAQLCSFCLLAL